MLAPKDDPRLSVVERAARRLDELRRAGIEVPGPASDRPGPDNVVAHRTEPRFADPNAGNAAAPEVRTVQARSSARSASEGAPVHAVEIDLTRLAATGYIVPGRPRTQLSDEFRVLKRPLLSHARTKSPSLVEHPNLIMVTSALAGEGKTFTSINLAMSIAMERDTRVLLVDADVSRPAVFGRLGLASERGLLDVLSHEGMSVTDVLLATNVDSLTLMPPGTQTDHATELLASDAMARLLEDLALRYPDRVIVFDAPPLLPSTESRALALNMGQIVLVVEAERTRQSAVTDALVTLKHCPIVLPVLNKTRRAGLGEQYGYYDYAGTQSP